MSKCQAPLDKPKEKSSVIIMGNFTRFGLGVQI
jgi:hypothetical protein